jgi:hypothetical protein
MTQALHSQARTTHLIREEIRNSTLPQAELARIYNVTRQTIRKWQNRDTPEDKSHAPDKMYTTLSPEQELIVVELRKTLLLPTDDLLAVTREFINPAVSRAGLGRCLRRHGVSDLRDLVEQEGNAPATKKTFKDYEPGFVHIDIKYLPQMPDETSQDAICSLPSTAPRAGSSSRSMPTRPTAAVSISSPRSSRPAQSRSSSC